MIALTLGAVIDLTFTTAMATPDPHHTLKATECCRDRMLQFLSNAPMSILDHDGDGIITEQEFRLWHLRVLGTPPGIEELTIFYAADADGDGQINYVEFQTLMKQES